MVCRYLQYKYVMRCDVRIMKVAKSKAGAGAGAGAGASGQDMIIIVGTDWPGR